MKRSKQKHSPLTQQQLIAHVLSGKHQIWGCACLEERIDELLTNDYCVHCNAIVPDSIWESPPITILGECPDCKVKNKR